MLATTTLPTWLSFSNLAWVVTGVIGGAVLIALVALAATRSMTAKAIVFVLAVGVVGTGIWYRGYMEHSRRTCSTHFLDANVRTPGCPIH